MDFVVIADNFIGLLADALPWFLNGAISALRWRLYCRRRGPSAG
jgi:hypothetical protein